MSSQKLVKTFSTRGYAKLGENTNKKNSDVVIPLHLAKVLQNFQDEEEAKFYLFVFLWFTKKESLSPTAIICYKLCYNLGSIPRLSKLCREIGIEPRTGLEIARKLEAANIITINHNMPTSIMLSETFSQNLEKYLNIIREKKPYELDDIDEETIKW